MDEMPTLVIKGKHEWTSRFILYVNVRWRVRLMVCVCVCGMRGGGSIRLLFLSRLSQSLYSTIKIVSFFYGSTYISTIVQISLSSLIKITWGNELAYKIVKSTVNKESSIIVMICIGTSPFTSKGDVPHSFIAMYFEKISVFLTPFHSLPLSLYRKKIEKILETPKATRTVTLTYDDIPIKELKDAKGNSRSLLFWWKKKRELKKKNEFRYNKDLRQILKK